MRNLRYNFQPKPAARVFDCFPFFNELDLLEIRLNELNNVVDKFVLVEATKTHSGKSKPLYFAENKERFKPFLDKIVYVLVEDYPDADMTQLGESWKYERHQRDCIARGTSECKDGDIIISSDIDEIPRAIKVAEYKAQDGFCAFDISSHTYYLNFTHRGYPYPWIKILPWTMAKNMSHCQIRYEQHSKIISDGGWHFSFMGDKSKVIEKIESWAHQEYNIPRVKDAIDTYMKDGIDPHGRTIRYKVEPMDDFYPKHARDNMNKFSHIIAPL